MIVEIVSTGTELLLGQIINSNAAYLAGSLNELGFSVLYQSTVGDNRERMREVLKTALKRADIVITTGGLGPTLGDITKEVSANLLNRELKLHQPTIERLKTYFEKRRITMSDNNLRQAMIHEGATIVDNACGTAPGVILEENGKTIIHLPGPPAELKSMFENSIVNYLKTRFGGQGVIISKVLRSYGLGESLLEERIKPYILNQSNPTIALLARSGEIHIRLTAKATNQQEAGQLIRETENKIRPLLADYIFGTDDETLGQVVGKMLASKKLSVSLAESCTGGLTTSMITDVPGSSAYLAGSVVCYSNDLKIKIAKVPKEVIDVYGAVSEKTAVCLAEGIKSAFSTDIGVGITGIAGPDGGSAEKPVGLVYIAVSGLGKTHCFEHHFSLSRADNKLRTALAALNHLRKHLLNTI